jgi:hypothetical protein
MLTLLCAASAHAVQVSLAPAASAASPGDTITIAVQTDAVTALGGFQAGFTFDPALLSVSAVRIGGAFPTVVASSFSNTAGSGMVAAAALTTQPTGSSVQLAAIDFLVKARGTASIGLTNVILGRIGGAEIPSTAVGGTVTISNYLLTVSSSGTGTGTVTSSPAGISCGADCSGAYVQDTPVTLTATASQGSAFQSWGGACTGILVTTCTVTMDGDRSVTAQFRDATPPNAPIVSGASPTNSLRPTWTWHTGGGGNGNYRFKLDDPDLSTGATATTATSFAPPADLSEGSHTLYVAERDADGNESAPGSAAIVIDLTPPAPPSGLTASYAQTGIRLAWTHSASPDIAKYRIYGNRGSGPVDYVLPIGTITYPVSAYTAGTVTTGTYQFGVRAVDAAGNEETNTTVTAQATVADFGVTLGVTKSIYARGENVPVTGTVLNHDLTPVAGAAVDITVTRSGFVRRYTAFTNAGGGYAYTFQPSSGEGGAYAVQATVLYQGMTRTADASFTIEGLVLSPVQGTLDLSMNSGKTVNISVTNVGANPVTGLQYTITDAEPGDGVGASIDTAVLPVQLAAGASTAVPVVINAGPTAPPAGPAVFTLRVTTNEGMQETATVTTTLHEAQAIPTITPSPLQMGVLAGTTAVKAFTIGNQGYLDMLAATVAVHDPAAFPWIAVSNCLPSNIAHLGTKSCDIYASPASMGHYVVQLDLIYNSTVTPFYLTVDVTTSSVGQVSFKVNDDTGALVSGAEVSLVSRATYSSVTPQGVQEYNNVFKAATGPNGYANFTDVPAGEYRYVINAPKHDSLEGAVAVEPGTAVQTVPVVLVTQLVTVDFSVTPTTITDVYTVTLNITYVTDLIKPTLYAAPGRVDLSMFPEETYDGVITIKNMSNNAPVRDLLLDASAIDLKAGEIEIIFANGQKTIPLGDLNFQSTIQVPFKARYIDPLGTNSMSNRDMGVIQASARYTLSIDGQAVESVTTTPVPVFFWTPQELSFPTIPCFVNDETDGNLYNLTYAGTTNRMQLRSNRDMRVDLNALGTLSADGRTIWSGPFNVTPLFLKGDVTTFDIDGLREALEADLARDRAAFLTMQHRLDFTAQWQDRGAPDAYSLPLCITTISPQGISMGGGGGGGAGGAVSGWSGFTPPSAPLPNEHGTVKIAIDQKTSLERQAFNVKLGVTPNVQPLTGFTVNLHIQDDGGNDASSLFYLIVTRQTGIDSLAGGTVSGPAEIDWQVVPSSAAGGTLPAGKNYTFWATIDYQYGGTAYNVTTLTETGTVLPMPKLTLDYTLPYVTMAGKPVRLAVQVTNNGYGPARSLVIQSAQPRILENLNNLPISFTLLGSSPTASPAAFQPGNLAIAFGDVAPGGAANGYWLLSTSRNGYFVEMSAELKHQDYLGVQLDPLIEAANTHMVPALGGVIGPAGSTAGMTVELLENSVIRGADVVNDLGSYLITDLAAGTYTWNLKNSSGGIVHTQSVTVVDGQPTDQVDYTLTSNTIMATAGPNGAISPSGAVPVATGSAPTFTMQPDPGYRVADVSVDGLSVGAVPSYTFSTIVSDHTISAAFALNSYTIAASAGANGTISPSGAQIVSHGTATVTYTITPDAGYAVADVLVDGASVGPVTVFDFTNITSGHTISAAFTSSCGTITLSPASLPTGTQGAAYSQSIVASGGTGPYSYAVTGGAPPDGLMLGVNGTLAGTITSAGSYTFTVTATDVNTCTGVQAYAMTINAGVCTAPPGGLVSWWQGEGSANDQMSLNHGALVSGATFTTGRVGEAFSFDGTTSYAQVAAPASLPLGSAARTVELWFRTPRDLTVATDSSLVQYGSAANGSMFGLITSVNAPGKLYFYGHNTALSGATTLVPDQWYHGAASYDGTTVRLYLNGVEEANGNLALNTVLDGNGLTIGWRSPSSMWQGEIDEVRLYDRALSAPEIAAIYNAGTKGVCDTIAPTVKAVNPANGAAAASVGAPISADFSEAMLMSSITASTFTLAGPSGAVAGSLVASGTTATFTPSAALASGATYTAVITAGAADRAGNPMAAAFVWSFATADTTAPSVAAVSPLNGAAGVPRNTAIGAVFSENMLASSITATTFILAGPSGTVTGGVVASGATATFTPSVNLASGATYTATITAEVRDLAGNGMASDYRWSFSTLTTTYTITAAAGPNGSITPAGPVIVSEGGSQSFTITPGAGYSVSDVLVDLVSVGTTSVYTFPTVTTGHTISASFVDDVPPTGTVSINGGAPATNLAAIMLSLTCADAGSGCAQAEISNYSDFSSPMIVSMGSSTNLSWTLSGADGAKIVYVRYYDAAGKPSLSELGTIVLDRIPPFTAATPPGGTYPANQTVTLAASELSAIHYTLDGTDPVASSPTYSAPLLVTTGTTTLKFFAVDAAGNAEVFQTQVYVIDANAPLISNVAPASGSFINAADVSYTLNKLMASGSVAFTRTGGAADLQSPHIHTLVGSDLTAGPHAISTGAPLKDGAAYSIAFNASDGAVSAPSVISTNVTFDATAAAVTINSPSSGGRVNTAYVSYLLSEPTTTGSIIYDDGQTQTVHWLSAGDLTAGRHIVNTQMPLFGGRTYTVTVQVLDRAGNPTAAAVPNVAYDPQAVAILGAMPRAKSIITTADIGYLLTGDAQSGTVTFTRTGGAADPGAPHVYTLSADETVTGSHTIRPAFTLVDGSFYTVSIAVTDYANNPRTLSNALVFMDSSFGKGPIGNVDNAGSSAMRVDDADAAKLNGAMNTRPGDPAWNPVCDLDRNGMIDVRDMMILQSHYGEIQ